MPEQIWIPIPAARAPALDLAMAKQGFDRREAIVNKTCVCCGLEVEIGSFGDDESALKNYHVSGLCVKCQIGMEQAAK